MAICWITSSLFNSWRAAAEKFIEGKNKIFLSLSTSIRLTCQAYYEKIKLNGYFDSQKEILILFFAIEIRSRGARRCWWINLGALLKTGSARRTQFVFIQREFISQQARPLQGRNSSFSQRRRVLLQQDREGKESHWWVASAIIIDYKVWEVVCKAASLLPPSNTPFFITHKKYEHQKKCPRAPNKTRRSPVISFLPKAVYIS